jgi:hypothetical protein
MTATDRPMIIEAPITEQVRELHANDLVSALLVHGICEPGQAAAMVAADRAKCERLILESIANENR